MILVLENIAKEIFQHIEGTSKYAEDRHRKNIRIDILRLS